MEVGKRVRVRVKYLCFGTRSFELLGADNGHIVAIRGHHAEEHGAEGVVGQVGDPDSDHPFLVEFDSPFALVWPHGGQAVVTVGEYAGDELEEM